MRPPLLAVLLLTLVWPSALHTAAQDALDIGSQLEPLVDEFLIERFVGQARLQVHQPQAREVVLVTDQPWEGNTCAYYTVFQDGDRYRMYYRGSHFDEATRKSAHPEVACYAESRDGIHWEKPNLELFEFGGSRRNNIVWNGIGCHNFTPFRDDNPACAADARYKALGRGDGGLYAFQSGDGIHWKLMRDKPVITRGAFDSQNLAFWDPHTRIYREYHRAFRGVRDIMAGTSDDFLVWTEPVFLEYPGAPQEHLYTNAIGPYPRAPHLLIGFPTRFLPEKQQVEPTLMTSRDGRVFRRWTEALIPLTAPADRDGNRSNYLASGLVQLPGADQEYSVYATEAYYSGSDSRLRRFSCRIDGFVSAHAGAEGGELVTKPLRFRGSRLVLNYATVAAGSLRVEIQDGQGRPLPAFAVDRCQPLQGDAMEQVVVWQDAPDLTALAGQPIRLRFVLQQADLYTLRFE